MVLIERSSDISDPRIPTREECVLPTVLERRALEHPDRVFAVFEDGRQWTYRETADAATGTAHALHALGVEMGDTVLCWLPNGPEALRTWFGAGHIGAIFVPTNTSYRGLLLEHVVKNCGAKVAVVHAELMERLGEIDCGSLEHVIVVGELGSDLELVDSITTHPTSALDSGVTEPFVPARPVEPWDTQAIIYTSGTTGPSKGVLSSYVHLYVSSIAITQFDGKNPDPSDRFLTNFPMFHIGGTIPICGMLVAGASIAVVGAFDTKTFWSTVRQTNTTLCWSTGIMATFLLKEPPKPDDRDNPLRMAVIGPLDEATKEFRERFGVQLRTMYNQTETNMPIVSEENPTVIGTAGRLLPGAEARIVDEYDREMPIGQVGEFIVRSDTPWALMHGYHAMPAATAAAWRNGWFHTGDALKRDAEGNYFFVDRLKDAIRRRGENVSSFEVERELLAHPSIREAVAVGVPIESDEDILAIIALMPGAELSPVDLISFLEKRMAYFMVPRYIRIVDALPMTPTGKVQKYVLRNESVTPDTWDREAAGIRLHRERL
jgi:crotonobetaine/carnitine-CoA ligase